MVELLPIAGGGNQQLRRFLVRRHTPRLRQPFDQLAFLHPPMVASAESRPGQPVRPSGMVSPADLAGGGQRAVASRAQKRGITPESPGAHRGAVLKGAR